MRELLVKLEGPPFIGATGLPHGWHRAMPVQRGGRVAMVTGAAEQDYQRRLAQRLWREWLLAGHSGSITGPVGIDLLAVFKRPARMKAGDREWCPKKPDDDNIGKSVRDAAQRDARGKLRPERHRGPWGLINDDAQVCSARTTKVYAATGEVAHILVHIFELG